MTYSRSLQGRFVSGRYTPLVLLLLSAVIWCMGLFLVPAPSDAFWPVYMFNVQGGVLSVVAPLLCNVVVAVILGMLHLHERRIGWLTSLFFFMASVSVFLHHDVVCAVSAMLFMVVMSSLLACHPGGDVEGSLFAAYALLGLFSFLLPQFVFLLPLFVVYLFVANIFGPRRVLAAILGLAMPFWFIFGVTYVWPDVAGILPSVDSIMDCLAFPVVVEFTTLSVLLLITELGVMLPAIVMFAGSSVPGKPFLRRRLLFIMIANVYLLALSLLSAPNFELLYAWRMPGTAVLASYLLSLKVTRLSNVYFVLIGIMWFVIAVLSIWVN